MLDRAGNGARSMGRSGAGTDASKGGSMHSTTRTIPTRPGTGGPTR